MNPLYTQRRNTTYAMSEADLKHIASFTGQSTRLYSLGGFLLGCLVNIQITCGVLPPPLPITADFFTHTGSWILGAGSSLFFIWGFTVSRDKELFIDHIRRECGIQTPKRLKEILYDYIAFKLRVN